MRNKIKILDDSVLLFENYIHNNSWEHVYGFPRNGLTYLIQNNAIKFFLTNDYFYKNLVASMELPLYIVDEELGIDGEYSDIDTLTEILDRIFIQYENGEVDLSAYLKKREAQELYQPIGDYVTIDEIDELFDDYYTKEEIDEMIPSVPSLSGYATQEWVLNQHYVTSATFITYIENLQNQIDSLQDALAACCSGQTGETLYRWITLTGSSDYICSGTTKYSKEQKQQSTDNGATWQNVVPAEYRAGEAIEEGSVDCGGSGDTPVILSVNYYPEEVTSSSWTPTLIAVGDTSRITFDYSYPSETTAGKRGWNLNKQTGEITYSDKCDFVSGTSWFRFDVKIDGVTTQQIMVHCFHKNVEIPNEYICNGFDKYQALQRYRSFDGVDWCIYGSPTSGDSGEAILIEVNSEDCGYTGSGQTIEYRWVTVQGDYICSGTTKYSKEKEQESIDGGPWTDTGQYRAGDIIETQSTDCGYIPPVITANSTMTYKATSGTTERIVASSLELGSLQVQLTAGTYTDIDISGGAGIYVKFSYTSNSASGKCSHSTSQISHSAWWNTPLTSINVGEGITYLDDQAFANSDYLETIVLPSTITGFSWSSIINCDSLSSVTINATTPPDIVGQSSGSVYLFRDCPLLTEIKVPANSVDAYKNNSKWNRYSSIIKSI